MSNLLWKYYLEDNVDKFENLLATGGYTAQHASKGHGGGTSYIGSMGAIIGSPGAGTSPRTTTKMRKSSGHLASSGGMKGQVISLTRSDLNNRDRMGLTILHRAVSSRGENAERFAAALISHPGVDLYIQDSENGWTALHRSLYFGNVATARQLMERDLKDCMGHGNVGGLLRANTLIKIKDHEGNSAFDVYNSTIARRTLHHRIHLGSEDESDGDDEDSVEAEGDETVVSSSQNGIEGDELFAFGSNKNFNLGFGDEDDRQYPTPVLLKRPDHLLHRFHQEHVQAKLIDGVPLSLEPQGINLNVEDLPALIRNRPIVIQDVALSKLHSAVLTTDPESNLYICGFGPGGRLGTGDETTKFNYVCIEGGALAGKKITAIALGQNHSIAISREGEVFTWGTNTWGQLGYNLPRPAIQDEEPINSTPRQIFGPLKRENILGVAASAIHSVAFTSSSLYTWGKNEGQLCLMDSDSRSLEAQTVPRKVAASLFTSPIVMVSAINKATVCLLSNHSVYVFTNYGYNIVKFPMHDGFANYHLHSTALTTRYEEPSHISQITSGGDTIAAVCTRGDLFTVQVSQKVDPGPTAASTTNPAKIRNALSQPQRIWSLRKGNWDGIQSVSVGENGSVIICTRAGAVWRRIQRATIKDLSSVPGKRKDFKFQRVPGLTNVAAVRSNTFGAYAAIRKDCDVTKSQVLVDDQGLWKDLAPLLNIRGLTPTEPSGIHDGSHSRFWSPAVPKEHFDGLKRAVLISLDLEADVATYIRNSAVSNRNDGHNIEISSTLSETSIPIHSFMFAARSPVMRDAMAEYRLRGEYSIPDIMTIVPGTKYLKIEFHGLDFITILNLALYIYEDTVIDVWHFTRHVPNSAYRYRQVRTELMKVAAKLQMTKLEAAVRLMVEPERRLNIDLAQAFQDPRFFEDGDAVIDLDGGEMPVHSSLLCRRCPFFEGLFNGRAAGQWLAGRRQEDSDVIRVDMKHVEPSIFDLVLRYLYADIGPELFDDIVSTDIDEVEPSQLF
jgi:alpha-tubulin suppressor-like RCC1 family protein